MKNFHFTGTILSFGALLFLFVFSCGNPDKNKTQSPADTLTIARAYNDTGLQYVRNEKNYEKGIIFFSKAIEIKPDYSVAYSNRGNAYRLLKQYARAEHDLLKAIEFAPNDTLLHNILGKLYLDKKEFMNASKQFSLVLEMTDLDSSSRSNAYTSRAKAYEEMDMDKEASADIKEAQRFSRKIK